MVPIFTLAIPAHLVSAVASGAVAPMVTSAGVTTTLTSTASGAIVGTASLVPVSGVAAAGAGTGVGGGAGAVLAGSSIALGPALIVVGAVGVVGVLGVLAYRRYKKPALAEESAKPSFDVINTWGNDDAVLAEAGRIVDDEIARFQNLADVER